MMKFSKSDINEATKALEYLKYLCSLKVTTIKLNESSLPKNHSFKNEIQIRSIIFALKRTGECFKGFDKKKDTVYKNLYAVRQLLEHYFCHFHYDCFNQKKFKIKHNNGKVHIYRKLSLIFKKNKNIHVIRKIIKNMKDKNKISLQKNPKNTKIFKQLVNIFGDIKSNVDHKNISHYIQMLKSEMKFLVKSKKLDIDNKDNYYALLYSITSIIGLMKDMSKLIVKDEKHVNIIFMLLKEKFDKFADKIFIGHLPKATQ